MLIEPQPLEKRKNECRKKKLIMNVLWSKYNVVRHAAKVIHGMRLNTNEEDDWDIMWCDGGVSAEKLNKMKFYQRINHYPGMIALARKNYLARNFSKMQKFFPKDYSFFPRTWLLPSEFGEFA